MRSAARAACSSASAALDCSVITAPRRYPGRQGSSLSSITRALLHGRLKRSACADRRRAVIGLALQVERLDVQQAPQFRHAAWRGADAPAGAIPPHPPELDEARQRGATQRTGEMVAPFGPVEAAARETLCRRPEPVDLDADIPEPAPSGRGDRIALRSLIGGDQIAAVLKLRGDGDPETAGEMV